MTLQIRPIGRGGFGAEVIGANPGLELDEASFSRIEQAWLDHAILVFRSLVMTPGQQIAFTGRLGPLHIMLPMQYNLDGHPEIVVVGNAEEGGKAVGMRRAGMGFHSDGEDKAIPNAGSFLHAVQVPPEGGDTLFADMYAAWEALPAAIRALLAGRRARFSRVELHNVHYPHLPPLTEEQKRDGIREPAAPPCTSGAGRWRSRGFRRRKAGR